MAVDTFIPEVWAATLLTALEESHVTAQPGVVNRDYEGELRRRGHSFPELLSMFGENVAVFDCIWYGMHEINQELVTQFLGKVEQIRGQKI